MIQRYKEIQITIYVYKVNKVCLDKAGPPEKLWIDVGVRTVEEEKHWSFLRSFSQGKLQTYPLVMTNIAVENRHFQWENPLFLLSFSMAMSNCQRVKWLKKSSLFWVNPSIFTRWSWLITIWRGKKSMFVQHDSTRPFFRK